MNNSLSIPYSRRALLNTFVGLGGGLVLPKPAFSIEPMTALVAASAVVSIVSGIAGMLSDKQLREGINRILGQLSIVIGNQERILEELRSLRLYFDEGNLRSWRDAYARHVTSYNDLLDVYFADLKSANWQLSSRLREDFQDLSQDCTSTTFNIGQMHVWAFPSFATGVGVVLLSERVLKASPARIAETKRKFVQYLDTWLADSGDLKKLILKTENDIKDRLTTFNSRSRTHVLSDRRVIDSRDKLCTFRAIETLTVSGSFEAGFSGSLSTSQGERECREPIDPCRGPRCWQLLRSEDWQSNNALALKSFSTLRQGVSGAGAATPIIIPSFSPSGYAIVDGFNRERIEIFELMATSARQKQYLERGCPEFCVNGASVKSWASFPQTGW
jgi:hypothetical protein